MEQTAEQSTKPKGPSDVAVKRVVSGIPRQRLIEWWSILNAKRNPSDMPKDCDPEHLYGVLTRMISKRELLDFWNGDFECGLQMHKYR